MGHSGGPTDNRHAGTGHIRGPDGPGLLLGLYARRPPVWMVLRGTRPVRRLDADSCAGRQFPPPIRGLGAGRHLLLPAHRLLARAPGGPRSGQESLHSDSHRRCGPADRYTSLVAGSGQLQHAGGLRSRPHRHHEPGGHHRRGAFAVPGGHGEIGPVPLPRLAARCNGGPNSGQRPDPRRHDGGRWCLPGGQGLPHFPGL